MFDKKRIEKMEDLAGKKINLKFFYIFPFLSLFLLFYNPLLFLIAFLASFEFPYAYLWFLIKERRKEISRELPFIFFALSWLISVYPVPKAISKVKSGEMGKIFQKIYKRYERGESFEKAMDELEKFDETKELREILLHIYRSGSGKDLLRRFADRKAVEYKARVLERGAKLQLFSTIYVTLSTVLPALFSSFAIFTSSLPPLLLISLISVGVFMAWKITE